MTLTELRYIVAVASERHFGRAAQKCFISQPTLSVSVKKLEDELGVTIFERTGTEVGVTAIGESIVLQAQKILNEVVVLKELAKVGQDPLTGVVRFGMIYTIGPYVLPKLMRYLTVNVPQLPLVLQENFTHHLLPQLRNGEIDVALLALPCDTGGLNVLPIYDEPFVLAVHHDHLWANLETIDPQSIQDETMLLLGNGHCLRDQVLDICPENQLSSDLVGWQKTFEGSSLETIRHMVAAGLGVTVLPKTAVASHAIADDKIIYVPFSNPVPTRRVALVWRKSFGRQAVIDTLHIALQACEFDGVNYLTRSV